MGSQGPGRKRIPSRDQLTGEEDALRQIAREMEAKLVAKRAARAEAREIRMKELERQQKELFLSHKKYHGVDNKWGHIEQWMEDSERYSRPSRRHASVSDDEERMSVGSRGSLRVEDRPERDFLDKGSRTASTLSAATLASLGGASSRRGSCDTSFSVETEASIRDIKDSLAEVEERYRRAMVSNAQLHNDKAALMYQVDTLREELSDMEEELWEARRHCGDMTKSYERERHAHGLLQFQFKEMKETLRQTEELLTEVSELRVKSNSYCQEVSDLQEALQWKEKKMAALERQREISDIVRIERNRLRDEVIRLQGLLKKHGVVVSVEITTNGETGLGEADDGVSTESGSRLAQETSGGSRESMLGKGREQQPAEGSRLPQENVKSKPRRVYKRSQSVNVTSATEQSKTDILKQGRGADQLYRDQRTEKHPDKSKSARKLHRNNTSEKDLLLRNEEVKKQVAKNDRQEVRKAETKHTRPRSVQYSVGDQALKGKSSGEKADTSKAARRDVPVVEKECSSADKMYKSQMNLRGSRPLLCHLENQPKHEEVVSPVCRTSSEKFLQSRLIPPRPVKDIILDSKAFLSSSFSPPKHSSLTPEKQDVALRVGKVTSVSDGDFMQTRFSDVDQSFQSQEKDGKNNRDGQCPQREVASHVPAVCVEDHKVNQIRCQTFVEESETFASIENESSYQSHDQEQQTVSDNLESHECSAFRSEGDCSRVSGGLSNETKLKTSECDVFRSAEGDINTQRLRAIEELKKQSSCSHTQETSFDHSKHKSPTKTFKSSAVSSFVPSELLKDGRDLEETIQNMLRGFVENQNSGGEISRNRWISELEEKLKGVVENMQKESTSQMKLTPENNLHLQDSAQRGRTEDPEHVEVFTASPTERLERTFRDAAVYVFGDLSGSNSRVHEDIQDLRKGNAGVITSTFNEFEPVESSQRGKSSMNYDRKQSDSDPKATNYYEDLIFVESYFAEPVNIRVEESASDQGLLDASANPNTLRGVDVVDCQAAANFSKTTNHRVIVPAKDRKDKRLKRHQEFLTNSYVDQSLKVRRLIETTAVEIEVIAVPELALMSPQDGRLIVHQQIEALPALTNTDDVQEMWVEDVDSCEEADEDTTTINGATSEGGCWGRCGEQREN